MTTRATGRHHQGDSSEKRTDDGSDVTDTAKAMTPAMGASPHRPRHPVFARLYARVGPKMDEGGLLDHRRRLLAGLSGDVIEVGAGNGLNFVHYPPAVARVVAVEPEPYLRALARESAEAAPVPVEVVDGVAERLPAGDARFDAAVASLVLCSVPNQAAALREIRRVLRPGGSLRFLEHVRAESTAGYAVQRLLDATVWPLFAGGCHTSRDTEAAIVEAGFDVEGVEHVRWPEGFPTPASRHILGSARRDASIEPVACSLDEAGLEARLDEWRALRRDALLAESQAGNVRTTTWSPRSDVRERLERLVEAERACCSWLQFELFEERDAVRLDTTFPPGAEGVLDLVSEPRFAGQTTSGGDTFVPLRKEAAR